MLRDVDLRIEVLNCKCLNQNCFRKSFVLPNKYADKYSHTSRQTQSEILKQNIKSTGLDVAKEYVVNDSTIYRWKRSVGNKLDFKDTIPLLKPSNILCIDEYKPKKTKRYDWIATDRIKGRILYVDSTRRRDKTHFKLFLLKLKSYGIKPDIIIVDGLKAFKEPIKEVFPNALIQLDYFHFMKDITDHFKNVIKDYWEDLESRGLRNLAAKLRKYRLLFIKGEAKLNLPRNKKQKRKRNQFLKTYFSYSIINDIVIFKEEIRDIFNLSKDDNEAVVRRNEVAKKLRKRNNIHFNKIARLLESFSFYYVTTYLRHGNPRTTNCETLIRTYRQMEKVRYGFKNKHSRAIHIMLFQIIHYLDEDVDEFLADLKKKP